MSSCKEMMTAELVAYLTRCAARHDRLLVAIAGPPGAGKSTLADRVHSDMNRRGTACKVVPMDGFHLDNSILEERGLMARKGAPETFDAHGFIELVATLKTATHAVPIPTFDRQLDCVLPAGDEVAANTEVVLVEGNYLLLHDNPWCALADRFDISVLLDPGFETLQRRLITRWLNHGLTPDAALARASGNDIPNARYVLANSRTPDIRVHAN